MCKTEEELSKSFTPKEYTRESGKTVNFKVTDQLFMRTGPNIKEISVKVKNMAWVF